MALGDLQHANDILARQAQACRASDLKRTLAVVLGHQARVASEQDEPARAVDLCREQEALAEVLGDPWLLQESLGIHAHIIASHRGMVRDTNGAITTVMSGLDYRGAETLYRRQEEVARRLGDKQALGEAVAGVATCLMGSLPAAKEIALPALWSQEQACRELGDWVSLANCLDKQAGILLAPGRLDDAFSKCLEAERLCRRMQSDVQLSAVLTTKGWVLALAGDLEAGLEVLIEAEHLSRGQHAEQRLRDVLALKADVLRRMGLLERSREVSSESGKLEVAKTWHVLRHAIGTRPAGNEPGQGANKAGS